MKKEANHLSHEADHQKSTFPISDKNMDVNFEKDSIFCKCNSQDDKKTNPICKDYYCKIYPNTPECYCLVNPLKNYCKCLNNPTNCESKHIF